MPLFHTSKVIILSGRPWMSCGPSIILCSSSLGGGPLLFAVRRNNLQTFPPISSSMFSSSNPGLIENRIIRSEFLDSIYCNPYWYRVGENTISLLTTAMLPTLNSLLTLYQGILVRHTTYASPAYPRCPL